MTGPLQREPYWPSGRPGRALLLPVLGLLSAAAVGLLYGSLQAHTLCAGFGPKLFVVWLLARRGGLAALQAVEPPLRDALRTLRIDQQRCPGCARGLWRVLEQLHYVHQNPLRALLAQTIWYDVFPLRSEAKASDVVVPLCWQTDGDRAELDRIAAALQAHPLTAALRRRR
jgi:hypothetical protein